MQSRRLFVEEVIRTYDYTSVEAAKKHIDKMLNNNWKLYDEGSTKYEIIYHNGQDELKYSVRFVKYTGIGY